MIDIVISIFRERLRVPGVEKGEIRKNVNTTVRTMSVTLEVFDLPAGTTVWSGHVRQTDRRNSNQKHTYGPDRPA